MQVKMMDHPRVCGDYFNGVVNLDFTQRITPAYAGTTLIRSCLLAYYQDHPRVCGDYVDFCGLSTGGAGSPPRMRGLHSARQAAVTVIRITPAYAGTTVDWEHQLRRM